MQDPNPAADNTSAPGFDLDAAEIRVLGVLIEKAFITPDAYPLSINAITTGCNQLTAREPVMSLSEAEVQAAVDSLIARRLVSKRDQQSARVPKYEHLAEKYPPLVAALPRAPGTKETRHVHLLGGDALVQEMAEAQGGASAGGGRGRIAELEDEVRRLREELDALRSEFATFRQQFD